MVKPKKPATSAEINAFIKREAPNSDNYAKLNARVFAELGVRMRREAVRQRARDQGVSTKSVRVARAPVDHREAALEARLTELLKKRKTLSTLEAIANTLDVSPARVQQAMQRLKDAGRNVVMVGGNVELSPELPKRAPFRIDVRKTEGQVFRFGVTGDNHLGSKYQRMDVLEALFDIWAKQDIETVYQLGNMIDGEARFNKTDLLVHGMDSQARYFAKHWPKRRGMTTYFVTGDDHEGWYVQREGIDIGRHLENVARTVGRKDLVYLGHMEHDIVFTGRKQKSIMRLIHAGGGSAYATSYSAQKIVESYQGGEKPNVLLIGHYHKAEYGYPREVHTLQVGCTCDQTPFMRKKKLQAHVGGWTIEMTVNEDGLITRFKSEWMPFYDLGYTRKAWRYQDLAA